MLKISILLFPLLLFAFYTFFYLYQGRLIFFPNEQNFEKCPEILRLKAQSIEADFHDQRVRLYLFEQPEAQGYIIVFHGNAGSACDRAYYLETLLPTGLNIVVAEYPGYSNDGKTPSETVLLANASALYQYIDSLNKQRWKIFLYGESLGTAVATKVAAEYPVAGLILQSPFPSLAAVGEVHYPHLPVDFLLRFRFPAADWAYNVKAKTLVLVAEKDEIIPVDLSKKQAANFLNLVNTEIFPGYGHNDLHRGNNHLWNLVAAFVQEISAQ